MAVAIAGTPSSGTVSNGGGSPSWTATAPGGITAGDLLILCGWADVATATTINVPAGWSAVAAGQLAAGGYPVQRAFYKIASGSEGNISLTVDSGNTWDCGYAYFRVTGHDATTPIPATNTGTSAAGTIAVPSVTVSNDDSLAVVLASCDVSGALSVPGTMTSIIEYEAAVPAGVVAYEAVDTSTYSPGNITWSAGTNSVALSFVIAPSAGGGGTPPSARLSLLGVG